MQKILSSKIGTLTITVILSFIMTTIGNKISMYFENSTLKYMTGLTAGISIMICAVVISLKSTYDEEKGI